MIVDQKTGKTDRIDSSFSKQSLVRQSCQVPSDGIAFPNTALWGLQRWDLRRYQKATVKTAEFVRAPVLRVLSMSCTFPKGFSLRNSGVLFVLPISIGGTSILAPTYRAAINALNAFLFPGGDHSLYVAIFAQDFRTIRRRFLAI